MDAQHAHKVYFDGGSRGNPGPAGVGWALFNSKDVLMEKGWMWLGDNKTNNEAEYVALRMALMCALTNGLNHIHVFGDSELIIKQILGEYECRKDHLIPHFRKCQQLIRFFDAFQITHVKRELNKVADALSNTAMDQRNFGEEKVP